jgi:hypothetical protein
MNVDTRITATVVGGMLKPDAPLSLAEGVQVQVTITAARPVISEWDREFERFLEFSREHPIDSGGLKFNRDQLHERR